jgi:hypothetical protein
VKNSQIRNRVWIIKILFGDLIDFAAVYDEYEDKRKDIDAERTERLELFQKKLRELRAQKETN